MVNKCKCGKTIQSDSKEDLCFNCYIKSNIDNDIRFDIKTSMVKKVELI